MALFIFLQSKDCLQRVAAYSDLLANPFALPAQKRAEITWRTPITKRGKLKYAH
ncbi:hypothetical protein AAP92_004651 [Salmonella enterica subsp. enterica serovar Enteritidis]|nr:hypothetical protein [Salmonella enterica subsp. enterica serovar Enteritidis]